MAKFIDKSTNLPHASYDLWEERFATHTYSVFVSMAALGAAAQIAEKYNHSDDAHHWLAAKGRINDGLKLLFDEQAGYYRKSLLLKPDGNLEFDSTLDSSSAYGAFLFSEAPLQDNNLTSTIKAIEKTLLNHSPSGGVPRYEHDSYFLKKQGFLGNPWIITSLWLAQYYIKSANLEGARQIMDWVMDHAGPSGVLAEQVDPENGQPVGVNPLVWSHSTFVETAIMLADASS